MNTMKNIIKSNLALDLGGKFTGLISYTSCGLPSRDEIQAVIINMPDSQMNYTVKSRTSTRHLVRSLDRYKKARKLIYILVAESLKRELSDDEKEALSSLMLRRGYTRQETELSDEALDNCSIDDFVNNANFTDLFNTSSQLKEQFYKLIEDKNKLEGLYKSINETGIKNIPKEYRSIARCMSDICNDIIQQDNFGHKHRKKYFEDITIDLKHDSRLKNIREKIGETQLFNLIGNISNLQLRALRWYFDDPKMQGAGIYDSDKLKNALIRAYKFFHYKTSEERSNIRKFIDSINKSKKEHKDALELLFNTDPLITIPPYEDQNNRNPPEDLTLLLNPLALDRKYPSNWEKWALSFISNLDFIDGELCEIVKLTDRKSRLNPKLSSAYTQEKLRLSYVLQRVFDLSRNEDKVFTKIRAWAKDPLSRKVADVNAYLLSLICDDEIGDFENLAREYYEEIELAKKGIWSTVEEPILEISNIHPQMKNKVLADLVANVLCLHEDFDFDNFKNNIWTAKIGRSTVRSICANIEKIRKSYKNYFNHFYEAAVKKYLGNKNNELDKKDKELIQIYKKVNEVSKVIAEKLYLDPLDGLKFKNPFSLAQLYNLIETDISGFSSNCLAVIKENNYRMRNDFSNGALCTRLAAESVRPFDGALRKILERQAYEIAKIKSQEIKSLPSICNSQIDLNILVEENSFEFSSSIETLKTGKKQNEKEDSLKKEFFVSKYERIKKDSLVFTGSEKAICAYTGEFLGGENNCEFDHIIPRSKTTSNMGTIFNSELNLIYVSQKGNQKKRESEYTLYDLSKEYLNNVFGTYNINEIKLKIEETVNKLKETNPRFLVDSMTIDERICARHALFMPHSKEYNIVVRALSRIYSTRVNGTQAYLVKSIISNIKEMLSLWTKEHNNVLTFDTWNISSKETHDIRENLSGENSCLKKQEIQPITSHAIDALCVFAAACDNKSISQKLSTCDGFENISKPEILNTLVPEEFVIKNISRKDFIQKDKPASKKLYKDTIYAEHFLPIIAKGEKVKIGFDFYKNAVEVKKGGENLLCFLTPFFKDEYKYSEELKVYHIVNRKVFDFIDKNKESSDSDEFKRLVYIFDALRYTTLKTEPLELIKKAEKNAKSIKNEAEKQQKIRTTIEDSFCINLKNKSTISKISLANNTKIILPTYNEFKIIKRDLDLFLEKDPDAKREDFFETFNKTTKNKKANSALEHRKCKRNYSIPVISAPSGGIRVKRKTASSDYVYQLIAANTPDTSINQGVILENNQIDFEKKAVFVDIYTEKNIVFSPYKSSRAKASHKDFLPMDERILLVDNENIKVEASLSTADRRKVFVTVSFDEFNIGLKNKFSSYLDLKEEYTLKDNCSDLFEYLESLIDDKNINISKPRNKKISFTVIGKTLCFSYNTDSDIKRSISYKLSM